MTSNEGADPALGRYPVEIEVPVAWGDMDALGHVNNTVFLRWFESARIAYFERLSVFERMRESGRGPILARATVDYRLPLRYPDRVRAAATVLKMGTTSYVMGYRLTSASHGGAIAAEGEAVVVMIDYKRGGKTRLGEEERASILELEASACGRL